MGKRGENSYRKGREAGVKNMGSGSKRQGRHEVQTPCSPPQTMLRHFLTCWVFQGQQNIFPIICGGLTSDLKWGFKKLFTKKSSFF